MSSPIVSVAETKANITVPESSKVIQKNDKPISLIRASSLRYNGATVLVDTTDVKRRALSFRQPFRLSKKPSNYGTPTLSLSTSSSKRFNKSSKSSDTISLKDNLKSKSTAQLKGISRMTKGFFSSKSAKKQKDEENILMCMPDLLDTVVCGMQDDVYDEEIYSNEYDSKTILFENRKDSFWSQLACGPDLDEVDDAVFKNKSKGCCMSAMDTLCCVDSTSEQ